VLNYEFLRKPVVHGHVLDHIYRLTISDTETSACLIEQFLTLVEVFDK